MQIANCWLKLDQHGSNVRLTNVTPAEVLALSNQDPEIGHFKNAGGFPVHGPFEISEEPAKELVWDQEEGLWVGGEKDRTNANEIDRLERKFGKKKVKALFPGAAPSLPQNFSDIPELASLLAS